MPYLEACLALDPRNIDGSNDLANAYVGSSYQYSKAVRVLENCLTRSDIGPYGASLLNYDVKRYRKFLAEFGDGHPWDNPAIGMQSPSRIHP